MPELVQAAGLVGQPVDQLLDAPVRPRGQPRAGDAQRQRQVAALRGDRGRGLGLRLHPLAAGDAGEQVQRLAGVEDIHLDVGGAGQAGEPAAAGDRSPPRPPLPGSSGDTWLSPTASSSTTRILPAGEQVAVHLRPLVQALGYLRARHAQRPQEPLEHLHRADRMRGPAVQVGEQLPVAEMTGHAVRGVHGDAGLADSRPCR